MSGPLNPKEYNEVMGTVDDLSADQYKVVGSLQIELVDKVAAKYKDKTVTLNKPRYLRKGEPGFGRKQYVVFVKKGDKVKRITFGDPNLSAKTTSPDARKSFRARHKCDQKKDKTTPGYWACRWPPNW